MLFIGICVMLLGTYANRNALGEEPVYSTTQTNAKLLINHQDTLILENHKVEPEKQIVMDIPTTCKFTKTFVCFFNLLQYF